MTKMKQTYFDQLTRSFSGLKVSFRFLLKKKNDKNVKITFHIFRRRRSGGSQIGFFFFPLLLWAGRINGRIR